MVLNLVGIVGIGELSADFPDERLEFVLQDVLLVVPKQENLERVGLEVGPHVVVERDDHFRPEGLCHAQDVDGRHLVLVADRVLAIGAERDVDLMLLAMLGVADGVVRVPAMVQIAARSLEQIVHSLVVHCGHFAQ